jgi:RNA polymerase sigma factor (sigma-70 family)
MECRQRPSLEAAAEDADNRMRPLRSVAESASIMASLPDDSCLLLMSRLRSGDDDAAARLFDRFAAQIIHLARRQLHDALRRKLDPEDVLQSVLRSFFLRCRDGQFHVANWDNLWGILMVMTVRKCGRAIEFFQAERRDLRREKAMAAGGSTARPLPLPSTTPTPEEAAMLAELLERLMRGLSASDREILTLHLQGHTTAEIGARIGRAMRTVRRSLDRTRHRLEAMQNE